MKTANELMQGLYNQALQNEHCDITIEVHDKEYGAHKGVLVQVSPYFERMFSGHFCETQSGRISLTDVIPSTHLFEAILEHMYLGIFVPSAHNIEEVLGVASLLLLDNLVRACQQLLLEQLTLTNVLHTWAVANLYSLWQLEAVCRELVRCRFHNTIVHQAEVRNLPLNLLCHFIKEGMFKFIHLRTKMVVLHEWLKENTTSQPEDSKLLSCKIAKEIETVEPELSRVLVKSRYMRLKEENVSCIVKFHHCPSQTLSLHIHDLHQGQLYESSQHISDRFSLFLGTTGRFIILQSADKQELCALDEKHQQTVELRSPVHLCASDHHYFQLGKNIMCLVVTEELDTQNHANSTFIAEPTEAPLMFWLNYVEAIDKTISDQPHNAITRDCKQNKVYLFQLEPQCWFGEDATERESVVTTMNLSDDPTPGTSSGLKPSSQKYAHPIDCLACTLTWKYICDINLPETALHNNAVVDFQSVESGQRMWVMLRLVSENDHEDYSGGTRRIDKRLSAFWFCLQQTEGDNVNNSNVKVEYLPSPGKHCFSADVSLWGRLEKCGGSVRLHIKRSCMSFNTNEWKWVQKRERHVKECGTCFLIMHKSLDLDPPEETCLPIVPKYGQIVPQTVSSSWHNFLFIYNTCPDISYLWRHNEEKNTWEELPAPSCPLDDCHRWVHCEVGRSALDTLPVVSRATNNGDVWDRDAPFAGFQFDFDSDSD